MKILSLDTSSNRTGFCLGTDNPQDIPVTGFKSFKEHSHDIGRLVYWFDKWLDGMVDGIDLISFEQPVRPRKAANLETFRKLYAIAAQVEAVCYRRKIKCFEVDNQHLKKVFTARVARSLPAKKRAVSRLCGA